MTLTRPQFELACKAYLAKYPTRLHPAVDDDLKNTYPSGWTWNEHASVPGIGYLSRSISIPFAVDQHPVADIEDVDFEVIEPEDGGASTASPLDPVTCIQHVVFSPTYQVPAFYFSMHRSNGAPLVLDQIIASPLFRTAALPDTRRTSFALDTPDSSFAMLSQGDHPTLNTPCWYLHPCHTGEVLDEIMREISCDGAGRPLRVLEAWFMVLGNLVDGRVWWIDPPARHSHARRATDPENEYKEQVAEYEGGRVAVVPPHYLSLHSPDCVWSYDRAVAKSIGTLLARV